MRLSKKNIKIIGAFIKAPIWISMCLTIFFFVFSLIEKDFIDFYFSVSFIVVLTLIFSYLNLIIFGFPAYFLLRKYNLFYSNIVLYFAFIIGFIQGFIMPLGGLQTTIITSIIFGASFGICALFVAYPLLKDIRIYRSQ